MFDKMELGLFILLVISILSAMVLAYALVERVFYRQYRADDEVDGIGSIFERKRRG